MNEECQLQKKERRDYGYQFILTMMLCYVAAGLLFISCFVGEKDSCVMISPIMMWIPAIAYAIGNWVAFFNDPTRYSSAYKCLGPYISCNLFSFVAGVTAHIFDMWTFWGLMELSGIGFGVRTGVLLPITVIGTAVMGYSYWYTETVDETSSGIDLPDQPDPLGSMFSFIQRDGRIFLYALIVFLGVVMTLQGWFLEYFDPRQKSSMVMKVLMTVFILGGLATEALALKSQIEYHPDDYCLPNSFK